MASEVMSDTKFGLPSPCESSETEEERNKRLASVTRLVEDVFSAVVEQIGPVEAKRIFSKVGNTRVRKPGRPTKDTLTGWDPLLLYFYDELVNDPNPTTLIRHLAEITKKYVPSFKYRTPQAIEKYIRRLLRDRKDGRLVAVDKAAEFVNYRRVRTPMDK
jgi:hypothetical protein